MPRDCRTVRILALEVRLRRLAFAVLEGPNCLLEWGIRRWGSGVRAPKAAMERIEPLLALYSPSVVVFRSMGSANKWQKRRRVIFAVKRTLAKRSIDVQVITRGDVRSRFIETGSKSKYQIAIAIAQMFPELRMKSPPIRKPWQTEHYNIAIFDAIASALAYQSQRQTENDS